MAQNPHLIFLGAATMDMIFSVERLPAKPGKVLPDSLVQAAHGMATSAATAASRLGGKASLITRIGDDAMGDRFVAEVEAEGVDCTHIRRAPGVATPVSAVIVDAEGERLIVPYYDKGLGSDPSWLDEDLIRSADATQVDVRWVEGAEKALTLARDAGRIAVLDGDVGPVEALTTLAGLATHNVFSAPAAQALTGEEDCARAVREMSRRFSGLCAVTDGDKGCYWIEDGELHHLLPPKVVAVDTLAAGDVFHGAFTLMIAEGRPVAEAVRFASAAAAIKCTIFGGRLGAPRRDAVEELLAQG
jgi:sugar/nucleoside kinase (ribokinase family)